MQDDGASAEELLQFHEAITACLNYAKELGWIKENPAEEVNPCADQAPIRFDEFILEWLGHSDIGTTSNIYTHLDYSNKVSSANAILPAYPDNVCVGVIG